MGTLDKALEVLNMKKYELELLREEIKLKLYNAINEKNEKSKLYYQAQLDLINRIL